jgi:hypothetical protein
VSRDRQFGQHNSGWSVQLPELVAEISGRLSTVFAALDAAFMVFALPSGHVAGF